VRGVEGVGAGDQAGDAAGHGAGGGVAHEVLSGRCAYWSGATQPGL
jgi:hypothetical protein